MDVSPVNHVVQAVPPSAVIAPDQAAQAREIVQAVKALNQAEFLGEENELQFRLDGGTRRIVVRVVNRKTKEVVSQAPPEYVLRLAEDLKKT
jgi:flagellar protein FlaG